MAGADRTRVQGRGWGDLRTARALSEHLPLTVAALAQGTLPVGHARALTRICLGTPRLREQLADADRGEGFLLEHAHLRCRTSPRSSPRG